MAVPALCTRSLMPREHPKQEVVSRVGGIQFMQASGEQEDKAVCEGACRQLLLAGRGQPECWWVTAKRPLLFLPKTWQQHKHFYASALLWPGRGQPHAVSGGSSGGNSGVTPRGLNARCTRSTSWTTSRCSGELQAGPDSICHVQKLGEER